MSSKIADLTITKKDNTVLTLNTAGTYVPDDKFFNIDVQSGAGAVTVASTDASIDSDSSNRNISEFIGSKSTTAPVSGYYLKVNSSGTGTSTITTAGWLDTGSMGTATANNSYYFPVDTATISITNTLSVFPSASVSGSHVTFSNTDNGISVTATGGGTPSGSVSLSSTGGFVPEGSAGQSTDTGSSSTTTASLYISGVTLTAPSSGTRSFSVTVPNDNNDTLTLTFTVDSNGNWTLE